MKATNIIIFGIAISITLSSYLLLRPSPLKTEKIVIKKNLNQFSLTIDNIYYYLQILNIDSVYHKEIMAQIIYETGHLCSNIRFKNNNLFGIKQQNNIRHYDHWTESIVHWKLIFYERVKKHNSYFDYLKCFKIYAETCNIIYLNNLKQIKRHL